MKLLQTILLLGLSLGFLPSHAQDERDGEPLLPEPGEPFGLDSLVLPGLDELPAQDLAPPLDQEGWADFEPSPVDPSILLRKKTVLPSASSILPPRAIEPEKRSYTSLRFMGNRVISNATLRSEISWALSEPIGIEEAYRIREQITRLYISRSYINSGVEDITPGGEDGELVIDICEGIISDVVLIREAREGCISCPPPGNGRLRDSYLIARVMGKPGETLSFDALRDRLQILRKNPNIRRISAEIKPGIEPGEAYVEFAAEKVDAWGAGVDFHNYLPPSVGSEQLDLWLHHANVLGLSDSISLRYGVFGGGVREPSFAGVDNIRLDYSIPIRRDDTTLDFFFNRQGYAIIEEPFNELAISGDTNHYGIGVRRPIFRDLQNDLWWSLSLSKKDSSTELLGAPFSISPGYVDGELSITILRAAVDWTHSEASRVTVLNAEISAGINALGSTQSPGSVDSEFAVFRMNAQHLQQLGISGHLIALRAGAQFADSPLPSPEQWALGGHGSVRGYRQNEAVDDMGAALGIEYRLPLAERETYSIQLVPFLDYGFAARYDGSNARSLLSAGLGLTASYRDWLRGEIFWGLPLKSSENSGNDLQDHGIHFQITAGKF